MDDDDEDDDDGDDGDDGCDNDDEDSVYHDDDNDSVYDDDYQRNAADGEQRIALCSLYLLFGIAMIAMSFNLLQEEVINSVKSLGKMCGIIKDNEDEEDY